MSEQLLIGWAERDITPETSKLIPLYGQYYERLTHEIHSRLKVTALAMSCGDEYFLEAGMDNASSPRAFYDLVCEKVHELEPSIDTKRIFLHAIHTHSAPSVNPSGRRALLAKEGENSENPDILVPDEYIAFALPLFADAIVEAWRTRKPGGIIRGFGNARIGHCRRPYFTDGIAEMYGDTTRMDFAGMEAGEDSGVEMLFTCDLDGKKTGLLLNVACPSQCMEATYKVSSDFAGATRELLKEEYGKDFHTIYQIAAAGCQSPRDLVRHFTTEPDFWHEDGVPVLANRLMTAIRNAELSAPEFNPIFKSEAVEITLPRRQASYEEYRESKAELARLLAIQGKEAAFKDFCDVTHANEKIPGRPGPYDNKLMHFVLIENEEAVIARYEDQAATPNLNWTMNIIRIGDIAIATNPFELFLAYGHTIKARAKAKQVFLVQLCQDFRAPFHAGYLPSPEAEKFKGYGGCIINGQCGHSAGFKLSDETVKAINEMFN